MQKLESPYKNTKRTLGTQLSSDEKAGETKKLVLSCFTFPSSIEINHT